MSLLLFSLGLPGFVELGVARWEKAVARVASSFRRRVIRENMSFLALGGGNATSLVSDRLVFYSLSFLVGIPPTGEVVPSRRSPPPGPVVGDLPTGFPSCFSPNLTCRPNSLLYSSLEHLKEASGELLSSHPGPSPSGFSASRSGSSAPASPTALTGQVGARANYSVSRFALALAFASHNCRVFASARSLTSLAALPASIERIELQVTDPEACERAVREVERRAGRIDLLVNNAGAGAFVVFLGLWGGREGE